MDFFDAQDRARKSTGKLLALYAVAVVLIILSVYVVALLILGYLGGSGIGTPWQPGLLLFVSALVLLLIITGTIIRVAQLRKGGSAVAEMLGGRKAEPSTTDFGESQLIHVVEEMAIASGMPVPDIYILDNETNINAFAAGFTTDDAAIGVTRGAIDQLSRDELQGVIAHEFSHIFNGDMRLNMRLVALLNGILLLGLIGHFVLRGAVFRGRSRNNSQGAILGIGLGLIIHGFAHRRKRVVKVLAGLALIVIPAPADLIFHRFTRVGESPKTAWAPTTLMLALMEPGEVDGAYGVVFDRLHKAPQRHDFWGWQLGRLAAWCRGSVASDDAKMATRGVQIAVTLIKVKDHEEALNVIVDALDHRSAKVRVFACEQLQWLGDRAAHAAPKLRAMAEDAEETDAVRRAATEALKAVE